VTAFSVRESRERLRELEADFKLRATDFSADEALPTLAARAPKGQWRAELLVTEGSLLDGGTLSEADFASRFSLLVLGVRHRETRIGTQPFLAPFPRRRRSAGPGLIGGVRAGQERIQLTPPRRHARITAAQARRSCRCDHGMRRPRCRHENCSDRGRRAARRDRHARVRLPLMATRRAKPKQEGRARRREHAWLLQWFSPRPALLTHLQGSTSMRLLRSRLSGV
jgi:hypothetical protein